MSARHGIARKCRLALAALVGGSAGLGLGFTAAHGGPAPDSVPGGAPAVVIQAHRGAGRLAPENTMAAFTKGWELGAVPESDIRMTKDDVLVAFHDATFDRLIGDLPPALKGKGVRDLTWEELTKLAVRTPTGSGPVPKIAEVFDAMRGHPERRFYIDVKEVSLDALAALSKAHGVEEPQLFLASPDPALLRKWKKLLPRSETLLWMGGKEADLAKRLDALRAEGFAGITQIQIHVHLTDLSAKEPFTPSTAFLRGVAEELKPRHILYQAFPWDCKDPAVFARLMELGVESFATDEPEEAFKGIRLFRERSPR